MGEKKNIQLEMETTIAHSIILFYHKKYFIQHFEMNVIHAIIISIIVIASV